MSYTRTNKYITGVFSRVLLAGLFLFIMVPVTNCIAQYDEDYISYDDFYQNLAPYGQWIEDPDYGYVWSPSVENDFRPYYTNGYWVTTDYGNTWVSDYTWGWACFHYGRWTYDQYYGWLWIPGNYWGPAWVTWRYGEGYYGWAPLGPDYRPDVQIASYHCPEDWWVFIPPQYLYTGNYYRYWYGPHGNGRIIENTTIINNTFVNNNVTYITGPNAVQVRRVTGSVVQVYKVRNSKNFNTKVHDDVVRMYKPAEIRPVARNSASQPIPPNSINAPKRIGKPQSINDNPNPVPPFRNVAIEHNNSRNVPTPGANINKTAEPTRQTPRTDNNPYEWDVSRHVKQDYVPPAKKPEESRGSTKPPAAKQAPGRQTRPQPNQPRSANPGAPTVPAPTKPQSEGGRKGK